MQHNTNKTDAETPPGILQIFSKDVNYLKTKDVKRAYSKLIQEFCKGNVKNDDAKTLAYLLAGYIQTVKQYELEVKIIAIEKKLNIELI